MLFEPELFEDDPEYFPEPELLFEVDPEYFSEPELLFEVDPEYFSEPELVLFDELPVLLYPDELPELCE